MPISRQLACTFVHIPKTGGSSVEAALGLVRRAKHESREALFGQIQSDDLAAHGFLSAFLQHLTISEIRKIAPESNGFFSFSFVRNPWDRIVSSYCKPEYSLRQQARARGIELEEIPFAEFVRCLETLEHSHLQEQWRFVCDESGRSVVDFVGRFENFQSDFIAVCERLEIQADLPHRGRSPNRRHYRSYYDDDTRRRVAQRYQRDIETFGYEF